MTGALADVALAIASLPILAASGYLFLLALLSRRRPPPPGSPPHLRFDVVVPAHDEEAGVEATILDLLRMDYPPELCRVIVVADNCTDHTADRARRAGALVLVRDEPARRGKGYALARAFQQCLADGFADAVVVVDADTVVSGNLLRAFSARLDAGAAAVQAYYGVRNAGDSWRTRLITIAFALFHRLRSLGRERLGVSTGLRGNGMCFATRVLRAMPHQAFSIVEDVEYGIQLGEAGHRVHYADEAEVLGEMATSGRAARSQRARWEGGRFHLLRRHGPGLLGRALRSWDRVRLDLALDLLVPPLSLLATATGAGLLLALAFSWAHGSVLPAAYAWALSAIFLVAYVLRGWLLSGTGLRGLLDLLGAPCYLAWKLALLLRPGRQGADGEWVRTLRRGENR